MTRPLQALRTLAFLLAMCAALSCSASEQRFELIFDPCVPLVLEPEPGASDEEVAIVKKTIALWEEVAAIEATVDPAREARTLPVHFEDDVWYYGNFDDQRGHLEVAREIEDADAMAIVLAHELGHAYGLYHPDPEDPSSVMNAGNVDTPPSPEDGDALARLWGECSARE